MTGFSRCFITRMCVGRRLASARCHGIATSTRWQAKDKGILVATYIPDKKTAQRTVLSIDGSQSSQKPILSEDIQRRAVPFDGSILPKMTPTLRAFTLLGKVAVVTGYVPPKSRMRTHLSGLMFVLWLSGTPNM